ncbi:DUF2167 domain-containing protein [Pseudocitrobacter cyperus]|uniref:DUF2167 domain-containing protein n=1 Tax=Pseudocitrobacter cyperus TaxID=3112843 RepID=UPI00398C81EB
MSFRFFRTHCVFLSFLFALSFNVFAANKSEPQQADDPVEIAYAAMERVAVPGPATIPLGEKASIQLPKGYVYFPPKESSVFMTELGNYVDDANFYGLIFHMDIAGFISIDYDNSGYIKDDDAKEWDADELLESLREGTKEGNKDRVKKGIPAIEVIGWVEKPSYDATTHRLIWSAASKDIGSNVPMKEQGVNYNTYLLGREGYFELNLITDRGNVDAAKPLTKTLLNAVSFNEGQRYSDYNAKTDKLAEYGLAALIGGIAAKKIGLLAMIGLTLLKFWKIAAIAVVAFGAGLKHLVFRKKSDD